MAVTVLGSGTSTSDVTGIKVVNKSVTTSQFSNAVQDVDGLTTLSPTPTSSTISVNVRPYNGEFNVTVVPIAVLTGVAGEIDILTNAGAADSITDDSNGFVTGGFQVGDTVMVNGSWADPIFTPDTNHNSTFTIDTGGVAIGEITFLATDAVTGTTPAGVVVINTETITWFVVDSSTVLDGVLIISYTVGENTGGVLDRYTTILISDKTDSSNRYILNITQNR